MKRRKILVPLLGIASVVGVVTPLVACSKEQEEKKEDVTITFGAVSGNIMGANEVVVKPGTKWSDINLPKVESYNDDYVFVGWFNGNTIMTNDMIVENDMYITARFVYQEKIAGPAWTVSVDTSAGTATITGYRASATHLVLPETYYYESTYYPITGVMFSNNLPDTQTLYISKNIKEVDISSERPNLLSIIVDPQNQYLTSQDANGKECNCVFDKPQANDEDRMLWIGTKCCIIPEGITHINNYAFCSSKIENITLPTSLKHVGNYAFIACTSLLEIAIPSNVESIGYNAFAECFSLKSVTFLGTKITILEEFCFSGCQSLETFVVPEGVKTIDFSCFDGCNCLKSVSISSTVEFMDYDYKQFRRCTQMESFTVASGNKFYSSGSNNNCLMRIDGDDMILIQGFGCSTIPSNCTAIYDDCFLDMPITSVNIPASVKTIGYAAFSGCKQLSQVTFDAGCSIDGISNNTFVGCTSLESIVLPSTVYSIGARAFSRSGLKEINKLENLKYVGDEAFANTNLKTFYIPKTIESMGDDIFENSNIETVEFGGTKADFVAQLYNADIYYAFDDDYDPRFVGCSDGKLDLNHTVYDLWVPSSLSWDIDDSNIYDLFRQIDYYRVKYNVLPDRDDFVWEITQGNTKVKWDENLPGKLINVSGVDEDVIKVKISLKVAPEVFVETEIYLID